MSQVVRYVYCLLLASFPILSIAAPFDDEQPGGTIRGRVQTADGQPASFVHVALREINKHSTVSENGLFTLKGLPDGTYTLLVSGVGLETQQQTINLTENQTITLSVTVRSRTNELTEVEVRGVKSSNQQPISIGKVAIRPMDLPQSVAVVERDILDRQQTLRLSDVLMNTNGVYVMGTTGGTQEEIAGRGFAFGSSNTFKNGTRFNNGVMPEVSALERVEVIKGSSAILFGNVAAGGIINLVTKKPRFDAGGQVSMRVGSYGFYKPSVDVYGGIGKGKHVAYRLNATCENSRSFRDNVTGERIYVNPSLLFKFTPKTELLAEADYLNDNRTADFGTGAINYTIADVPRSRFLGVPWAYNRINQTSASATLTHHLNDTWQLRATGALQHYNSDLFSNQRPNGAGRFIQPNGDWIRGIQRTSIAENYYVAQVDLTGKFTTGRIKHTLLIGADADRYRTNTTAYNPLAVYDTINIFNLNKYQSRRDIPMLTTSTLTQAPIERAGIYAQDLLSLSEKIKVLAGLRWSYQQTGSNVLTYADGKTTSAYNYDAAFSPRFGIVYQPTQLTALFVSYSNSFNLNTGVDVAGNALPPSFINQYEAGIKNDLFGGLLSANVTAYQIINSNLAQTSLAGGNTNNNIKELAGEVTSRGIEIDLKSKSYRGFSFIGGYSYNQTKYTRSNTYTVGSLLRYNPNHTANASLYYAPARLNGLNIGVTAFYTGDRVAGRSTRITVANDTYKLMPIPSFTQLDLSVGYNWRQFSLRTKVSNVLNVLSYYVHDDNSLNPIAPRMLSATLSFRW